MSKPCTKHNNLPNIHYLFSQLSDTGQPLHVQHCTVIAQRVLRVAEYIPRGASDPLNAIRLRSHVMDFTLSCRTLHPNYTQEAHEHTLERVCSFVVYACVHDVMVNHRLNFSMSVKCRGSVTCTQRPLWWGNAHLFALSLFSSHTHFPQSLRFLSDHLSAIVVNYFKSVINVFFFVAQTNIFSPMHAYKVASSVTFFSR